MIRQRFMPIALLLGLLLGQGGRSAEPDSSDRARIARLIGQLGNDDFKVREAAGKELEKIGVPALKPLEEALKSTDAEVRRRAEDLLDKIGSHDPAFKQALLERKQMAQIASLIAQLDNAQFALRESASQGLVNIGVPALVALKKTAADPAAPLEVRTRVRNLITRIEKGQQK
ncbi:MAG: HEAT repeat domain-containing protein [Planctomycetia bacterium]|nr:HEAT repeat domain-containing protein [Planctomycetia bacterium]